MLPKQEREDCHTRTPVGTPSVQQCWRHPTARAAVTGDLPSITVCSIDIHTKLHQELHNFRVARTHSIVQSCDALIIGQARVVNLRHQDEGEPSPKLPVTVQVTITWLFRIEGTEIGFCGLLFFFFF